MMSKQVAEAMRACETALEIAPSHVKGLIQLGQCHAMQSNAKAAISCFDRALALKPNSETALSNKIFAMDLSEDADFAQQQAVKSAWWHQIGRNISEKYKTPHQNRRDLTKQIVLGYVSADYNSHSAAFAIHPIMRNHDKSRFDIICYSTSPKADHVTETFRSCANRWRDASQWSDDVLAECIRADGVDILIDLSGHTEGNRLGVFARKPAPVQVTAWGHATGTGLPTIDYLFADPVSIPAHVRHIYAEQIRDLPCVIAIEELPAHLREAVPPKLVRGCTTYGVFNRVSKFSDAAIAAWARILIADGESRMLIKDGLIDDVRIRSNLVQRFATHGIAAERIDLQGATSREDHLAAYAKVDICLDPFPYGGGVSTWEALYMGVPVVAKLGNTVASRMSGAILSAVGLAGWVVSNEDEYVERALQSDAARLQGLRSELPGMIALRCGPTAYTTAVEDAYQAMWAEYCGS
jgi:predicted O-linked N-acetylglucosamine transferase (SPINDLY family)